MIVKTIDFELEISNGSDIYFGSRTSGQIFKKWDEIKDNVKLRLESVQNKIGKLILESEEILSAKEIADNLNRDRSSGIERRQ